METGNPWHNGIRAEALFHKSCTDPPGNNYRPKRRCRQENKKTLTNVKPSLRETIQNVILYKDGGMTESAADLVRPFRALLR
jgi:hypothetical protein